jgi:hypothetical protein
VTTVASTVPEYDEEGYCMVEHELNNGLYEHADPLDALDVTGEF